MASLHLKCETCGKTTGQTGEPIDLGGAFLVPLGCGHLQVAHLDLESAAVRPSGQEATSAPDSAPASRDGSGHDLYEYQKTGKNFLLDIDGERARRAIPKHSCLLADDMGVGKTPQACAFLQSFWDAHMPDATIFPVLISVKGATMYNWAREIAKWTTGPDQEVKVMICSERKYILPGFDIYIMSHDLLATGFKDPKGSAIRRLEAAGIKTVIVDEAQAFKDPSSARTRALITLITSARIENRIFLSGTPIKSRASEYFTILNLIDPRRFNSEASFKRQWLMQNEKGAYSKIQPWKLDEFREVTRPYILRRTRDEVLTDLPPFTLNEKFVNIEDFNQRTRYNNLADKFQAAYNSIESMDSTSLLGWFAKMRRLAGEMKVLPYIEELENWLESTEVENGPSPKICIGIHHRGVLEAISFLLRRKGHKVLTLSGSDDNLAKDQIVESFKADDKRILIVNALAGGVGLNIQFCNIADLVEHQWTPSDEDQYWGRFHRNGQTKPVTGTIWIAKGTIDEFFVDLKREKRQVLGETLDGWNPMEDGDFMKDLAERVAHGRI